MQGRAEARFVVQLDDTSSPVSLLTAAYILPFTRHVRTPPGHNAPLIRFLDFTAVYIVCLFILYVFPRITEYTAVYDAKLTSSGALGVVSRLCQHADSCSLPMVAMVSHRQQQQQTAGAVDGVCSIAATADVHASHTTSHESARHAMCVCVCVCAATAQPRCSGEF